MTSRHLSDEEITLIQRLSPEALRMFFKTFDPGLRIEKTDAEHLRERLLKGPPDTLFVGQGHPLFDLGLTHPSVLPQVVFEIRLMLVRTGQCPQSSGGYFSRRSPKGSRVASGRRSTRGHPLIEATALFVASLIVDGVYGVLGQSASTAV